jgi:acetyltransferase-like isoleucine patch superfamily enzyme
MLIKLLNKISVLFSTFILYIFYSGRNISLGENCNFWGLPILSLYPSSKLIIGDNSRFRSTKLSNLIGINHRVIISTHSEFANIEIGCNSGFSGTTISCYNSIIIGDGVLFGANTVITDFDWHNINPMIRHLEYIDNSKPVVIDNNVFIGLGTIILKGVHIGKNSIIGAGSVVTSDIPENVIAAGNPCKILKEI